MSLWPEGLAVVPIREWPGALTPRRRRSDFASSITSTMETLRRELRALSARDVELQVAIDASQFRLDGKPYANAKATHPGVILTLEAPGIGALSYPCDTFERWEDNLRAIALALESLRRVERYNVAKRGQQYRGFMAIEATRSAPSSFATAADAREYLLTLIPSRDDAPVYASDLVRLAKRASHPDLGGDADTFQRVTLAEKKLRDEGLLR